MTEQAAGGGRTRITTRALERVTAAVAGEALGAPGSRVGVQLTDREGALDVALTTAVRTVSLSRAIEEQHAVARSGGSVLHRAEQAERTVRTRVGELTGYSVRQVDLRITAVQVRQERRVR